MFEFSCTQRLKTVIRLKKILATMFLVWTLSVSSVYADSPYPIYFNGDKNFVLIWGRQGYAHYIDKSSIKLILDEEPFYIISVQAYDIITYGDRAYQLGKGRYWEFLYDEEETEMFFRFFFNGHKQDWSSCRPQYASYTQFSSEALYIGEAIFYLASPEMSNYHRNNYLNAKRKFYGSLLSKDRRFLERSVENYDESKVWYNFMFPDWFYKRLDGISNDGDDTQ